MEYRINLVATRSKKIYMEPEGRDGIYLYPAEIKKEGLEDGMVLTAEELESIRLKYALPRAKKRALGILVRQDQTTQELREKLLRCHNDSRSVEEALVCVSEAGYVDDLAYARDYLSSKKKRKSFRMIRQELMRKGISNDDLDLVFEEAGDQEEEDVADAIKRYARRFSRDDPKAPGRICAHFCRKGYEPDLIREIIHSVF